MAFRTWVRLLLATLGVGALAGASQLGVAYGLGILRLTRVLDVTMRDQWTAQLAWVAWFAMVAAVVGALAGSRLLPRWSPTRRGTGTTVAIALAAGIGAAVVVPLTMQPARTAHVDGVHPVFVIGICAGLGALAGVFAAAGALIQPVSRWSLTTLGVSIWVIAIISVSPSLASDDPLPAVRLGVFDAGFLSPSVTQRMAPFTMPALALIAGALLGWVARRRELPMLTIALAGLPGPALLTVAYLIAGPGSGDDRYQVVPYWAAMTATGAGVLGSVLATVLRRGTPEEATDENEPTDDRPPLPRRTGQAESAIALAGAPLVSAAGSAQTEQPSPMSNTRLGRSLRPFSRGHVDQTAGDLNLSGRSDRPGRDQNQREAPATDPPVRKRRGWRRGKPSDPIDPTQLGGLGSPGGLGAPRPRATNVPPTLLSPPSAGRTSPLDTLHPATDPAFPMGAPARPLFAGAPIRDDRTPAGRPFAPEPQTISAPLPHPQRMTPPVATPEPVSPPPTETRRSGKRQRRDDDYVDWVSGLGGE